MKRFFALLFVVAIIVSSSVIAYAATLPHTVVEDGNTYLRTFNIKDLTADQQEYFENIITSDYSVVCHLGDGDYSFFIVPDGCSVTIRDDSHYSGCVDINSSPTRPFRVLSFSYNPSSKTFNLSADTSEVYGVGNILYLAGGNFWSTVSYNFPTLDYKYIADIEGRLIIEWNTQGSGGGNWWNGLLDWISSFWQKFIDMLKSLFIPSPDYFENFFNDIRNAFDEKVGGLSNLINSVSSMFSSLKGIDGDSSLSIKIPDNQFFNGYDGLQVDILKPVQSLLSFVRGCINAILVISTIVICYQKLITAIRG